MNKGLISSFYQLAYQHPEKNIFTYLNEGKSVNTMNYGQLDYKARQIATLLKSIGSPGDTVLVMYPPGLDFIAAFIGCAYAQMIIVPVMPPVNYEIANKLKLIVDNAKPFACLTTKSINDQLNKLKLINQLGQNRFLGSLVTKFSNNLLNQYEPLIETNLFSLQWLITDRLPNARVEHFELPKINPQAPLFLQYTSGSTGTPKGVIVTHGCVMHNIEAIKYCLNIGEKDILYSWLPQYHDMGLIGCILTPMYTGLPTIIDSPLNFLTKPLSWLQGISQYRCTISAAPNFAYELCANKITEHEKKSLDLSCWRVAVNSAEPIRATTIQHFYNQFQDCGFKIESFYPSYGLAEATLFVTTKSLQPEYQSIVIDKNELQAGRIRLIELTDENAQIIISSGDIDPHIDQHKVIIVNTGTWMPLADETLGEIWVSSPSINPGYWKQEKESQETFQACLATGGETYLKTGDLGFIKEGQLYVTGRIKDLIIIRGKNYYPQDIEYTVEQSHSGIRAGCVNAFSVDNNNQEELVVLVEIKTVHHYDEIKTTIILNIMQHHGISPSNIVLLAPKTLKKTTSGKVCRQAMKTHYLANELPALFSWARENSVVKSSDANDLLLSNTPASLPNEISLVIINSIKHVLRNTEHQEISTTNTLIELGFDSLLIAELLANLKPQLPENIELSIQDIIANPTIDNLIQMIKNQAQDGFVFNSDYQPTASKIYSATEQHYWMDLTHLPEYVKLQSSRKLLGEEEAGKLYFNIIDGISDNFINFNNKEYINFSGYNYLGYSGDKRVIDAAREAISRYGTSVSASRLVSGQKPIHYELEQEIASLIGTEDALVFTAGHATNVSVITHLFNTEDVIFHDALIHNSSLQGAIFSKAKRIPFPHNDFNALANLMENERHYYRRALVLIEGAYSMDGDIPNVPEFVRVKNKYNAYLMLDEAHSIGVIGLNGFGIREYFSLAADDVDLWMGTLSKAFASCGGYIAGKKELIDYLKYTCGGFVFSAGMPPANAAAALMSIRLLKQEPFRPQKLQHCASKLLSYLQEHGVNTGDSQNTPIIPIIVGNEMKAIQLCLKLRDYGIYTIPIIYPAVDKGLARIRLFINYMHTEEQIAYTAEMICKNLS